MEQKKTRFFVRQARIIKNNIYYMKHIKIFEARKTYAQKSKELREKFLTLIDANISDDEKAEIEDVLRSIFDIVGSPNFDLREKILRVSI